MQPKNLYSNVHLDRMLEYCPREYDMYFRFYLLQLVQQFDVSFDREQSKSIPYSLYCLQMTTIHLFPVSLLNRHFHRAERAFHSEEGDCLFFSQSDTVFRATPNVLVSPRKLLRS